MSFPRLHNELVSELVQELIISDFQTVLSQWPCDPVTSKASLHTAQPRFLLSTSFLCSFPSSSSRRAST